MYIGFDWVVVAIVILIVLVLFSGIKQVPQGYNYADRAVRPLHENAEARPQPDRAVHRPRSAPR